MIQKNEHGRSMVEMLGVLAVIGVLSVGGIAGYQYAMNRHRANEILTFLDTAMISADAAYRTTKPDQHGNKEFKIDVDGKEVAYHNSLSLGNTFKINKDVCRILAKEIDVTKWDYLSYDMFGCGGAVFVAAAEGFLSYTGDSGYGMWGALNCIYEGNNDLGYNTSESSRLSDCDKLTGDTIEFWVGA